VSCVERCVLNIIDLYFPELREQISYVEVNADLQWQHRLFLYERPQEYYQRPSNLPALNLWYKRAPDTKLPIDSDKERRDAIRASLKAEHYTLKNMVRKFILQFSNSPEEYLRRLSEKGIL